MNMGYNSRASALASAARTATTTSSPISGKRYRGVIVYLTVTAASGTGGLKLIVRARDEAGNTYELNGGGTAIVATGNKIVVVFPSTISTGNGIQDVAQVPLPLSFDLQVTHADASSYTYSLAYELIA